MKNYNIYLGLVLLAFVAPLSGVASDAWADAFRDALLKEYSAQHGGTNYNTLRLPAPSRSSSEFNGMGETVGFKNDSAWKVESYKIIGKVLPATDFMEAVTTNGLFLVVTYVVRNDSQRTDSILVSPQISDEQGNHYDAYDMEEMYIERVMHDTSKTIGLQQLNPRMTYTFSAIYQIPDATQAIMFNARELGSIAPDTKAIYLVDKNTPQKAAIATPKANEDPSRIAAEQEDASAQNNLGLKYYEGKDYAEAARCFRNAAKQGHADAQFYLGKMYASGTFVPKDMAEALKLFRKAAEQGHARAQFTFGVMYDHDIIMAGDQKFSAEAMKWYRKSADQGYAEAQCFLGTIYYEGTGVPKDYTEAAKWLRKAAHQGDANAQNNLGLMYANGEGVPKDYTEAAKWYRKAAEQGNAYAQANLGRVYANGTGVPKDDAEAVKWLRLGAEKGDANAQFMLGVMYYNGEGGLLKDRSETAKWWRKAADQGHVEAQGNLSGMYYRGIGIVKDLVQAHVWMNRAAAKGYEDAKKDLLILEKEMTPEQIILARELFANTVKQ